MNKKAEKLILIGIDSLILDFTERFIKEGLMPNIKRLMENGSYGYALPSMPTFTPPNWTTIATGADPSIHGIKGWVFDSRACKVEFLWTVAARAGKKVVLLRYPCGYPATHPNVIAIANGA
ncbi:MAG: alkaline phosphatase family protein, partial [Thermoprotei archaeon]|nr:alkaline phosphatase family protein [Thermoprotei archaeon]